ncbi:SDR family oxidoreductase [Bradyrhizobium iriomotense]|uniref:SDR family oxidoreductase n=1 Tax=Bradyrhizobium iriomotense TaxID=441950 RepID=UPI003D9AD277
MSQSRGQLLAKPDSGRVAPTRCNQGAEQTSDEEQRKLDSRLTSSPRPALPLGEITVEHYDQTFDVNVKGLVFTVQKALPLTTKGASIILTGSSTGVMGTPQFSIYSATKAAIRNLARSWAQDLRGTGIRVNVLSPGPTKTELALEVVGEEAFNALGSATPIGRVGDLSETGAVAAFLASSDSSFMTGGEVFVDGGLAQV